MHRWKLPVLWAGCLAAAAPAQEGPAPAPVAAAPDRSSRVFGYVEHVGEENGRYWLYIAGLPMRFALPRSNEPELEPYLGILAEAAERGVGLWVHFDAAAGQLSRDGRDVVYPLCSLQAQAADFGSPANCPAGRENPDSAERMLALGIAALSDRHEQALALLAEALAAGTLGTEGRLLALKARVRAADFWAETLGPADPRHDPLLVEALADTRRWEALRPGDVSARFMEARLLGELGAYDEAMELFREIGERDGYASYAAIAAAALHRRQGRYEAALRELDSLVAREGPQDYMPFHYHRGWTLLRMGHHAEAVAAFSEGLRFQPDYGYAYLRRACALSELARLSEALADHERAVAALRTVSDVDQDPKILRDIADSEAVAAELRDAIAAGRREPVGCRGPAAGHEEARARSPLLPPR